MIGFRANGSVVEVTLSASEVAVLTRLDELIGGTDVGRRDPARERLYPTVYGDDAQASREFERFAARERHEMRAADRERFAKTLEKAASGVVELDQDDAAAWARVLGEARLIVAARRGLFESSLPEDTGGDPEVALVMLLGYLQEGLVGEMLKTMEDMP